MIKLRYSLHGINLAVKHRTLKHKLLSSNRIKPLINCMCSMSIQ